MTVELPAVHDETIAVSVWRGGAEGHYQSFEVPARESQTVLDIVTYIQRHLDASLAYRFACRVGMCGSCAMMVNGVPRWTCRTHADRAVKDGKLTLAPLRNLPVIRDLVADLAPFFDKWRSAGAAFVPTATRDAPVAAITPDTPARQAADAGIECINCAVCYAACDTVTGNPDDLGPAALNRVWTLVQDQRDGGNAPEGQRLQAVMGDSGCANCHSHQSCAELCPNGLNPTASIAGLKRLSLATLLRGGA